MRGALLATVIAVAGCAGPRVEPIPGASTSEPPLTETGLEPVEIPPSVARSWLPKEGTPTTGGVRTSAHMAAAYHARRRGDRASALAAIEREMASFDTSTGPLRRWWVTMVRSRTLIERNMANEARDNLTRQAVLEREVFDSDLLVRVMRADLAITQREFDVARREYRAVLNALGTRGTDFRPFASADEGARDGYFLDARSRARGGIGLSYLFAGDCERALAWIGTAYREFTPLITRPQRFPWSLFLREGPDLQEGFGWLLSLYGTARACHSARLAPSLPLFEAALDYFASIEYADGPLIVASLWERAALATGDLPLPTRQVGPLDGQGESGSALFTRLAARLPNAGSRLRGTPPRLDDPALIRQTVPAPDSMRLPPPGTLNVSGVVVSSDLARANEAYLAGRGDAALAALERADATAADDYARWHHSHLRVQILIMMGRSADAEIESERTAGLERVALGTDLNARALRGEARAWLGHSSAARRDFEQVLDGLGEWRLPTRVPVPPAEVTQFVALVRAALRARLGLALAASLDGDFAAARAQARRAEAVLNDIFYLVFNPTTGRWLGIDSDMFYGRGLNLGILAAATLALGGDRREADALRGRALAFFDALGFTTGRVLVEGLHARALLHRGSAQEADVAARAAAQRAAQAGLPDLVWQLRALSAHALLAQGRDAQAEVALRHAQDGLAVVSGSLASDRARRRFGIGKDDITRALAALSARRGDWPTLFEDLERGRARAFVDMLALRTVTAPGAGNELARRAHALSLAIRRARVLRLNSPSGDAARAESTLLAQRNETIARLRAVNPALASTLSVDVRSLRATQARLRRGEALVYALPAQTPTAPLSLLRVTRTSAGMVDTSLRDVRLRRALRTLQRAQRGSDVQTRRMAEVATALKLEEWLPTRRLYVVPSGDLYRLPWGALDLPAGLEVVVLPTGDWLTRDAPTPSRAASVIVGDPEFGGAFEQLPGARDEAKRVAARYRASPLLGASATLRALRERIGGGARVLHLATHGQFDVHAPLRSSLLLSDGREAVTLTAADLFAAPLPSRLVVLSACETGMGRSGAGDDYLGLARSFYLGGARAVVNSLWRVPDAAAARFMDVFHRDAARGHYARGWRAARDALRADGEPPSVYGAFVLGGSAGR